MKTFHFTIFLFSFSACGAVSPIPFDSLSDQQPKVVSIRPAEGENFDGGMIEAVFSRPVDPATVTAKSFVVAAVEEASPDVAALWSKAKKGETAGMEGVFEISSDGKTVRFVSNEPFPPDERCGVLILPTVLSVDHLPLNQTPGEGPTPFFSSFYTVQSLSEAAAGSPATLNASSLSRPAYLKLNEIFYDAAGSDANGDLFIELLGEPGKNIAGYQLLFIRGDDGVILDSLRIPDRMKTGDDGFFVAADAVTNQPGQTHVQNADWVANFDPPNGPDCIQLLDHQGSLVDVVGYGSPLVLRAANNLFCYDGEPAPDAPSGSSLNRLETGEWMVSSAPSPGESFEENPEEE